MRFSVVVTIFNLRRYAVEAVESVLVQRRRADQIVLVDDGSTDGSGEWLEKEYGAHVAVKVVRKANGGQLSAFKSGLRASDGDVVCFLDADDRWTRDYLERLERIYRERPEFSAVFANVRFFGATQRRFWDQETQDRDLGLSVLKTYLAHSWEGVPSSAISMRRPLAEAILSLPEDFDDDFRVRADDVLVTGAALLAARRYYLAEPLVEYRHHDANLWLGKGVDRCEDLRFRFRRHALISHLGARLEPAEGLRRLAAKELKTKERPEPRDLRDYLQIVRGDRSLSWFGRLSATLSIRRCYRRLRKEGSIVSRTVRPLSSAARGSDGAP